MSLYRQTKFSIERDTNGQKLCRIRVPNERSFRIQTNQNMPRTHKVGICVITPYEFKAFVLSYGTDKQKEIVNKIDLPFQQKEPEKRRLDDPKVKQHIKNVAKKYGLNPDDDDYACYQCGEPTGRGYDSGLCCECTGE